MYTKHLPLLRFAIFMAASCLPLLAWAHAGSLTGTVYDQRTQQPLTGVSIYLPQINLGAVTNALGVFSLSDLKSGKYDISISCIGYQTVQTTVIIEDNKTTTLDQSLLSSPIHLRDVVILPQKELTTSTVSGIDLHLRPISTTQDMLRLVPGLFIAQHAGGGKAEQIFLRGFDVDHGTDVAITVDGMPVNMVSHAHGQGYADLHFLIPELVDKVNFAKGPYALNQGNFATAGFIEFNTQNKLERSIVKMEGGMYGNFRTMAAINLFGNKNQAPEHSGYVAGEYVYNRGYFDHPQNFHRLNLMGKYTHHISARQNFSFLFSLFRSSWDASGQIPTRLVSNGTIGRFGAADSTEGGNTSRYNFNFQYVQASDNGKNNFKLNVFLTGYDFELYSNFTFFLRDSINGDQIRQKEQRIVSGTNSSYTLNYKLGKMEAKTILGAGFRYDHIMNNELSRTRNRTEITAPLALGDIHESNIYGYAGQTVHLLPQLVLQAGLRLDYFIHDYHDKLDTLYNRRSVSGFAFSPKASISYNFREKARVFFQFGTGFHSNDTRVVIAKDGRNTLPLAFSYDLGIVGKPFKKLLLSATVWLLDLQQEFVYVGDEAVVEPGGRTRRMGVDLSVRYELLSWLFLDADMNYTYARARDEAAGMDFIPLAPQFTAIGGVTFMYKDMLSASLRFRYMGDRPANEDNSVIASGYALADAVIQFTRPRYELRLQAQNLFNTAWNEAQFDTESRLKGESAPVSEIHFTPGTPFSLQFSGAYKF